MQIAVVTLFPELFEPFFSTGLIGKAVVRQLLTARAVSPRDYTTDKHRSVDDTPYGGGSGMVMRPEPIIAAVQAIEQGDRAHRVILTPRGRVLRQADAERLSRIARLVLVCGRYEGVDERVHRAMDEEISLGDFVLMGGEVAAMCLIESVARLCDGVLGNPVSLGEESHSHGLLEYPQYTRPPDFLGEKVPEVLTSGNHEAIRQWRRLQQLLRTRAVRPDLFARQSLSDEDQMLLATHDAGDS